MHNLIRSEIGLPEIKITEVENKKIIPVKEKQTTNKQTSENKEIKKQGEEDGSIKKN